MNDLIRAELLKLRTTPYVLVDGRGTLAFVPVSIALAMHEHRATRAASTAPRGSAT